MLCYIFRPCPHVPGNFFCRKYCFADTKIYASTRSVFESFTAVHTYPIVFGNFLICSSAQFFCRRESWNDHAHNCDLASFLPRHSYCKVWPVEACSLSLEKMFKSSEKVKKKYADTYKWTDDEVELLLTVNNLKTSCRSLKFWLCKFITAAFIWTHDIKLEIRAINKEDTTLLYAMFV